MSKVIETINYIPPKPKKYSVMYENVDLRGIKRTLTLLSTNNIRKARRHAKLYAQTYRQELWIVNNYEDSE